MGRVSPERSGWRDIGLSERHRAWGWDCPAVDIDFLMLEYNEALPIAIVEYKNERAQKVNIQHPTFKALHVLATRADIHFLYVRYATDFSWFKVAPLNEKSEKALKLKAPNWVRLSEDEYVRFLHDLRAREHGDKKAA